MGEIQKTTYQTPIEIALGVDENGMTTAKKLYAFLELRPGNFARWCKVNIVDNEFATENEDYLRFFLEEETPTGGKIQREDFKLTAHFAKKLSVKGSGAKAEQAREYFTRLEERVKQKAIDRSKLPVSMQIMYSMMDEQAKLTLKQQEQEKKIQVLEQKQETIAETFKSSYGDEDFKTWVNRCIGKIAESPNYKDGASRSARYQNVRSESYDRLNQKRSCRLTQRVAYAKEVALQNGATKTAVNNINRLSIISGDKDLKPIYETVVREMMIAYCVDTK